MHSVSASDATVNASSAMKITVEIVWHGFKEGHVVSIGVFGAMRPDARAASGATHRRVRWCRVKLYLEHNGSILCGGL
jgi:hypothetical protein